MAVVTVVCVAAGGGGEVWLYCTCDMVVCGCGVCVWLLLVERCGCISHVMWWWPVNVGK